MNRTEEGVHFAQTKIRQGQSIRCLCLTNYGQSTAQLLLIRDNARSNQVRGHLRQVLDNLRLSPLEKGDVVSVQYKELRQGWLSSAST
jgi:hypothetical protein